MNVECPHSLGYLFVHLFPSDGSVWGGFKDIALLEKACHRGLEFIVLLPPQFFFSASGMHLKKWSLAFLFWVPTVTPPLPVWTFPLETEAKLNSLLSKLLLDIMLYHNRKVTNTAVVRVLSAVVNLL